MTTRVTIIGDGQMALVMADALVTRGVCVRIWGPFPEHIERLGNDRGASRLTGFHLPDAVELTADDAAVQHDVDVYLNAIPTQFIRSVWRRLRDANGGSLPRAPIICVSKGIENDTLMRPTEIIRDALDESPEQRSICALSGPTIAAELAERKPATMVAACGDAQFAEHVQDMLNVPWLRIYRHDDVDGVEIAGATKNVIALAAGMVDGLDAGVNAKSALLARGLAEIARLGQVMGARKETFFGIAGVGDLATTCFSTFGRNRSCGEALARGVSLKDHLASTESVVEGVATTKSIVAFAERRGIDMPITRAVHAILFEGLSPRDAIRELMERTPKAEHIA